MLTCSRPVSNWLNLNSQVDAQSIAAQLSEGSPIDRAIGTILMTLGIIVLVKRYKTRRALSDSWPILLFLTYCLLSVTWSDFPDLAFKRLIREVGNLIVILIVWTDPHPINALKRLLARAAYTLIPLSVLFCRYYPFGRHYGYWTGEVTYTGVLEDKNGLAQICLIFGLYAIWRLLGVLRGNRRAPGRTRQIWVQFAILLMCGYLFWLADSVTSRSCMVLATAILLALHSRVFTKNRILVHLLVFATIAIPVCVAILGASPAALQAMGRDSSLTDRTLIWAWVLKLVPNQWLGAGYASFWLGKRLDLMIENVTHTWVPNQAHNGYLDIYANLGWIGVALLALVIIQGYSRVIYLWRLGHPAGDLMLAYFVVGLVTNISEASFFRNMFPLWLMFILAITIPRVEKEKSSEQESLVRSSIQNDQFAFSAS